MSRRTNDPDSQPLSWRFQA